MDMLVVPIGGFFPLLHPEIYFVALDADEGNVFLTSQKYDTQDDMMAMIVSLVIFDGFPFNSVRWVFVHCPAAQYRYSGC